MAREEITPVARMMFVAGAEIESTGHFAGSVSMSMGVAAGAGAAVEQGVCGANKGSL
jgi:hypothetical protein